MLSSRALRAGFFRVLLKRKLNAFSWIHEEQSQDAHFMHGNFSVPFLINRRRLCFSTDFAEVFANIPREKFVKRNKTAKKTWNIPWFAIFWGRSFFAVARPPLRELMQIHWRSFGCRDRSCCRIAERARSHNRRFQSRCCKGVPHGNRGNPFFF